MAIAPEDLVSARSRQDGGHALTPGRGGDDVGIDAVHGRLVHRPEEAGDGVEESPRIQQDLAVVRLEPASHASRVRDLAVGGLVEPDGERGERPVPSLTRQRHQRRRVDPAAQEDAEWHVADQVKPDRVLEERAGLRHRFGAARRSPAPARTGMKAVRSQNRRISGGPASTVRQ